MAFIDKLSNFYVNKYLVSPFSTRKYFISYDFEHKALWFRVYKVASRTIDHHLRSSCQKGNYIYSSQVGYTPGRYSDYFKFAFVRNPVDRFISAWKNKVIDQNYFHFDEQEHTKMKTLENFVEWVSHFDISDCDEHLLQQSSLIDINHVDFIGRHERFDQDFEYVCSKIGIKYEKDVHINKSSNKKIDLPEEVRKKIIRIYQKDISIFYPEMMDSVISR
jgi:hypothetical protein